MSQTLNAAIAVIGIDIGKNSFHIVGHDERGAIVLRQKWSRGQVEARLANMPAVPDRPPHARVSLLSNRIHLCENSSVASEPNAQTRYPSHGRTASACRR